MKKILPIGKDDFRKVRETKTESYYVDKSLIIKDFLDYEQEVTLITRPRRFGKTLNMTMIREFLDITVDSEKIFDGLAIMGTEYKAVMNTIPVVFLSFKNCTGQTIDEIELSIAEEVFREYKKHAKFLENVDKSCDSYTRFFQTLNMLRKLHVTKEQFRSDNLRDFIIHNLVLLKNSLSYLAEVLYNFYEVRPVFLIDEYDNPIIESHIGGFRDSFTEFYSTFLSAILKGNNYLNQALLTGIQRVAKESIFSKLNNISVYSVLDNLYSSYFGLTEKETKKLLEYYELTLNNTVKMYYDGYVFADYEMYNPWSILNFAQMRQLKSYWLKTSTNSLIQESVLKADYNFHSSFENLIKFGYVRISLNLEASFIELPRTDTLWGLFVNAGYLSVVDFNYEYNLFTVKIPNKEIETEFKQIVSAYTKLSSQTLQNMLISLIEGEMSKFLDSYQQLVLESTSFYDSKENAYHMLFLGMVMNLRDMYNIKSNIESGYGRSDIIMESTSSSRPHILLEFKQGTNLIELKREALSQIEEKKYFANLSGEVLCVGIAHNSKKCEIEYEYRNL